MVENELVIQFLCNTSTLALAVSRVLDGTSKLVVLLGNGMVCGLCNTHVGRSSSPLGFMCCAHGVSEVLVFDEFRVLCLCCVLLVFSELPVCAQRMLVSRGIRAIPRLERENVNSKQVEADRT